MADETQGTQSAIEKLDLHYPLNEDSRDYGGRLIFNVMKEAETDLGNVMDTATNFLKNFIDPEDEEEGVKEVAGENPEEQVKGVNEHKGFTPSNQTIIKPRPLTALGRQVSLYLPIGLQYRDNVAYDNMDLGGMGAAAEAGLQSGQGAISALIEGGLKTLQAGLGGNANKDVAKLGAVKLVSALPDEIQGAFRSAAGVTSNPNTRVLFKQVNLREFAFTFKFLPSSRKEAEQVKEIIKLFRTELYPEDIKLQLDAASSISIGYRFPNKFQIDVEYKGEHVATKIKPCYLRDVSVTYNNTAMSMHSDGNFQEIEMSLSFQEARTLNRKDVEDGF